VDAADGESIGALLDDVDARGRAAARDALRARR
jgi:hypothetical protein